MSAPVPRGREGQRVRPGIGHGRGLAPWIDAAPGWVLAMPLSSFILLNMECHIPRLTDGRGPGYTTSTLDVKSSLWKRISSPARFIILFQSIVIAFLSFWIHEEYLNNRYLQAYVNDVFQTEGWAIGILAVMVGLGAVAIPLFLRKRTIEKNVEAVPIEAEVAVPVATGATEVSPKPADEFHPVVAALKAELAGKPLAFGTVFVPSTEEQRTVTVDQPTNQQPIVPAPKAELAGAPVPSGAVPVSRAEDATASAGAQPPVAAGPTIPRNVTTVITGVIPIQKKREPEVPAEEKPSSQ